MAQNGESVLVKQLRSLATIGIQRPSAVAKELNRFDDLRSAIGLDPAQEEGALGAKRLCNEVMKAIEAVRRKWRAETKVEAAERDQALRALDATFGLGEFDHLEGITHRREAFLGGAPGSGEVEPRTFTRGLERKVLTRLADQLLAREQRKASLRFRHELSCSPVKEHFDLDHWSELTGIQVLKRLDGFLEVTHTDVEFYNAGYVDLGAVLLRLADLYLGDLRPAWAAFDVFAHRLFRSLQPIDQATGSKLRDYEWVLFAARERELLDLAVEEAQGNRHLFLEHLEAGEIGQGIIAKWLAWVKCECQPAQPSADCSIQRIRLALETVFDLCDTGRYHELVEWLDMNCDPAHPYMPPIFPIYLDE
jgi:hypothetical protein